MDLLKHIDELFNLYLSAQQSTAESMEPGLLRQLERSQHAENPVAGTVLQETASVMPERVEVLSPWTRPLMSSD